MTQIIILLRRILIALLEILSAVRTIAANTTPPPDPKPTSIRWHVGEPREE